MQLVKTQTGKRCSAASEDAVTELRDLGARLDHVLGCYGRLVNELADEDRAIPDFHGRVDMLSSHLAFVAQRLQELLILQHEVGQAAMTSATVSVPRRRQFPRPAERAMA